VTRIINTSKRHFAHNSLPIAQSSKESVKHLTKLKKVSVCTNFFAYHRRFAKNWDEFSLRGKSRFWIFRSSRIL